MRRAPPEAQKHCSRRTPLCACSSNAYLLFLTFAGAAAAQTAPGLREAARLDQAGRCQESEVIYQRALAETSPGPALLNNTGNHYLICGQPAKARVYFERLLKLTPAHPNANLQMARIEMAGGAFARAEEILIKLADAHPGDFDVLFLLGRAAARAGHLPRARESLEAALRLRPDDAGVMLEAGLANAASGDFPRAVFLLARARGHSPKQPDISLALARASEDAGYYGDAVAAYDHYLALSPGDDAARRDQARARALTSTGREAGIRDLQAYTARQPKDPLGHFYLAQLNWREQPDAALASLAEAVRLDPNLAPAHISRAWLLHRVGRAEEALPSLEAALRIAPNHVRALDQLGVTLLSLDRPKEAEAALRKAAAVAPTDADVALHLGRALVDQGREAEGQAFLDAFQKLRPSRQRDARRESGMIELATLDPAGRRAREIERFRSMAKARPDDPLLQLHLAGLLLADGQTAEALREYDVLASLNAEKSIWAQAGIALLDAGHFAEARVFLARGFQQSDEALHPDAARAAALLLAYEGHHAEALALLARTLKSHPADRGLLLMEAIVLALKGDAMQASAKLSVIQTRWRDWALPCVVHGLLLTEAKRPSEAAVKFRAAGIAKLSCATLREWVFGTCGRC
ncbi:MAG: tetratricopeptide repeat protein [Acidobacteria bacterium]|nr:tetratricopeptide repeat protein [Acidobacteriota bacterium]